MLWRLRYIIVYDFDITLDQWCRSWGCS